MIKFTQKVADDTSAAFSFYDFQTYVDKHSAAMLADGVRWSLRPDTKAVFDKNELNAVIADDQTTFARATSSLNTSLCRRTARLCGLLFRRPARSLPST